MTSRSPPTVPELVDRQAVLPGEQRRAPGAWRGAARDDERATGSRRTARRPASRATGSRSVARPMPRPDRALGERDREAAAGHVLGATRARPRAAASRTNAWSAASRARSSAGGPSSGASPASARVVAARRGPGVASPTSSTMSPSPRERRPDARRRRRRAARRRRSAGVGAIAPGRRLVVEADVAAGDRQAERPARVAQAAHRLAQLPERLGPRRVAEVQAVRDAQRPRAGDRDVARRLGDAQRRAQPRVERADAPGSRRSRRRAPWSCP